MKKEKWELLVSEVINVELLQQESDNPEETYLDLTIGGSDEVALGPVECGEIGMQLLHFALHRKLPDDKDLSRLIAQLIAALPSELLGESEQLPDGKSDSPPVPYQELNLDNYDSDDVAQLNEWGIWAISQLDLQDTKPDEGEVESLKRKNKDLMSQLRKWQEFINGKSIPEANPMNAIAAECGWHPLVAGEAMVVHWGDSGYRVTHIGTRHGKEVMPIAVTPETKSLHEEIKRLKDILNSLVPDDPPAPEDTMEVRIAVVTSRSGKYDEKEALVPSPRLLSWVTARVPLPPKPVVHEVEGEVEVSDDDTD